VLASIEPCPHHLLGSSGAGFEWGRASIIAIAASQLALDPAIEPVQVSTFLLTRKYVIDPWSAGLSLLDAVSQALATRAAQSLADFLRQTLTTQRKRFSGDLASA